MATFVLVHGAWHGGWCWQRVRRSLQSAGHEVFTPTPQFLHRIPTTAASDKSPSDQLRSLPQKDSFGNEFTVCGARPTDAPAEAL